MGSDMLMALGAATVSGRPLFGVNCFGWSGGVCALPRQYQDVEVETLNLSSVSLPQVRQTCAVLGLQAPKSWGLSSGVNEHGVAIGLARWRSRLPAAATGLRGDEAVRLTLERSQHARQALEVLGELIARFGIADSAGDAIFLIADGSAAYVLEAAGAFWALSECQHMRAVSDAALIRQDWLRLAPGLAEHVFEQGWWGDDGTKLDFAGCLSERGASPPAGLRRWGKATLLLAQHNGALDVVRLRRILPEHFRACMAPTGAAPSRPGVPREQLLSTWLADLGAGPAIAWQRFGRGDAFVYFPLVVDAELPVDWAQATLPTPGRLDAADCARLQAQFDQDADEFRSEAARLYVQGDDRTRRRLGQVLMQKHVEQWQEECRRQPGSRLAPPHRSPVATSAKDEDSVTYAFG